MKGIKSILMAAFCGIAAASSDDAGESEKITTDVVDVEFQGSSGGFKLSAGDMFIQVDQDKLEEIGTNGKTVGGGWNVAGGSFGEATTTKSDAGVSTTMATFTKSAGGIDFAMSCILTSEDSEVFDPTVNETVNTTANSLKFSIAVSGWEFRSADNKLQYAINIKDKSGAKGEKKEGESSETAEFSFGDGGIQTPLVATADGEEVEITVEASEQGSKNILTFTFPSFEESLVYDPDVAVGSSAVVAGVSALSMIAAFLF